MQMRSLNMARLDAQIPDIEQLTGTRKLRWGRGAGVLLRPISAAVVSKC